MGPNAPGRQPGPPGEKRIDKGAIDIPDGGSAVPYWMEDPYIRPEFEETLRKEGVVSRMEDAYYQKPKPGEKAVDFFVGGM
jgi:hypothetical protein